MKKKKGSSLKKKNDSIHMTGTVLYHIRWGEGQDKGQQVVTRTAEDG